MLHFTKVLNYNNLFELIVISFIDFQTRILNGKPMINRYECHDTNVSVVSEDLNGQVEVKRAGRTSFVMGYGGRNPYRAYAQSITL